jgi:hypothetical protein
MRNKAIKKRINYIHFEKTFTNKSKLYEIKTKPLLSAGGILLLNACSSPLKVTSDYDKSIDFSTYKTFGFYQLQDKSGAVSQLNQNRIIDAVKKTNDGKRIYRKMSEP